MDMGRNLVRKSDVRPNGQPGHCYFCGEVGKLVKVGEPHADECVIPERTVVAEFTVNVVLQVPRDCPADELEEWWNGEGVCGNSTFDLLMQVVLPMGERDECLCGHVTAKLVREATVDDEKTFHFVPIEDEPQPGRDCEGCGVALDGHTEGPDLKVAPDPENSSDSGA